MSKRVIINGVSYHSTLESMTEYFSQFGPITDALLPTDATGRVKGFAFVTFVDGKDADKVLAEGAELEFDGRRVRCQVAKGSSRSERGGGGGGGRRRERVVADNNKLYVGGLPPQCNSSELREAFERFGEVTDCYLAESGGGKDADGYVAHKGFGFVEFSTLKETTNAVNKYPHTLKGHTLRVSVARPLPESERKRPPRSRKAPQGKRDDKGQEAATPKAQSAKPAADKQRKPAAAQAKKAPVGDKKAQEKKQDAPPADKSSPKDAPPAAAGPSPASGATAAKKGPPKKRPRQSKLDLQVQMALRGASNRTKADRKVVVPPAPKTSPWGQKAEPAAAQVDAHVFPTLDQVVKGEVQETAPLQLGKGKEEEVEEQEEPQQEQEQEEQEQKPAQVEEAKE